tara:strand:- start:1118 stop:1564 length:447 start_codon:yes stop_codon:yes gene_type:complete
MKNQTKKEIRKTLVDYLEWSRNFHDYDKCSAPHIDELMKNNKLKTNEGVVGVIHGYQFHNLDVSNLYEHSLRMLWGDFKTKRSKKSLKALENIISVTTDLFYKMTDKDIPNWHSDYSYLESLIRVKNHIVRCSEGAICFTDAKDLEVA